MKDWVKQMTDKGLDPWNSPLVKKGRGKSCYPEWVRENLIKEKPIMEIKPLQVTRVFMNEYTTGLKRELTVRKAIVFGKTTVYPACDRAKLFADLAGTITLRAKDLEIIKKLGFLLELEKDEEGV